MRQAQCRICHPHQSEVFNRFPFTDASTAAKINNRKLLTDVSFFVHSSPDGIAHHYDIYANNQDNYKGFTKGLELKLATRIIAKTLQRTLSVYNDMLIAAEVWSQLKRIK